MGKGADLDLSSFICIVLMICGSLLIVMVANVVIIMSNPENLQISSAVVNAYKTTNPDGTSVQFGTPFFGNKQKEPMYVEINKDRLIIYPDKTIVRMQDLEKGSNPFEKLLLFLEKPDVSASTYVILALRPGSARAARRVQQMISARGIDVGVELFDATEALDVRSGSRQGEVAKAASDAAAALDATNTATEVTAPAGSDTNPVPPAAEEAASDG